MGWLQSLTFPRRLNYSWAVLMYYRVVGSLLMGTYVRTSTVQNNSVYEVRDNYYNMFFLGPKAFFNFCVYHISIGSTVSRTLATGIWLSSLLASVGLACLITSSESGLPHWTWSVRLKSTPARTWTHDRTIGPCQAMTSLLICVVLSPRTWGYVEGGYQHWL